MKAWIEALRLRTLPLSAAGVIIGGGLALYFGIFSPLLFILMLTMALLLQIISNFADEYGDLAHGVDNEDRVGPIRGMQRGDITQKQMKVALIIASGICGVNIIAVVLCAFGWENVGWTLFFVLLGVLCIAGAIKYTVGKGAYGYYAIGDFASFFFFGIVAVCGGFFLYAGTLVPTVWFPAVALGSLVAGMLNLNNMRDIGNDAACGKRTVAVLLGKDKMRIYQFLLVGIGMVSFVGFNIASEIVSPARYVFILPYALYIKQLWQMTRIQDDAEYDRLMKPHSLTTVLVSIMFALCIGL